MEKFADRNYYSQSLQTSKYEHSDEEYWNYQQREHQYWDEQDECDYCENADPYDPHEIDKWAHCFYLPIEVNNSVFKGALTVKIATFKIHVDVLGSTTRAHRPVIIHKPNRLPAIVAGGSFLHYVKAHEPSVSPGYGRVYWLLALEGVRPANRLPSSEMTTGRGCLAAIEAIQSVFKGSDSES